MEKRFFIYDLSGNPSDISYSVEEILQKNLPDDTFVCPERGKPGKIIEYEELSGWRPPKIPSKDKGFSVSKKLKYTAIATVVALSSVGGALYLNEKQSHKASKESKCIEYKKKLEYRIDSLNYEIKEFNNYIEDYSSEIINFKNNMSELRIKSINYKNKKPVLDENKKQLETLRDKAASEICFRKSCFERRKKIVNEFNQALLKNAAEISNYESKSNEIDQVLIPDLESKITNNEKYIEIYNEKIKDMDLLINQIRKEIEIPCEEKNH